MGGKKNKTMANKLAKMSDEERARYMQHRADIEEEAKKRKEQLIATFIKKKIKKEDAFSRLNLAKINQQWHQILRKAKCQEMKENVTHMKKWIDRVLEYKNRTIAKLLDALEEGEEQYSNNFQYHSWHNEDIIESQNKYIEKLQAEYNSDLENLLEQSEIEVTFIQDQAEDNQKCLETILFGQSTLAEKTLTEEYDYYMLKMYETNSLNQSIWNKMSKSRERMIAAIWRHITEVIKAYIEATDTSRMHLGELQRLDREGAEEIRRNDLKIQQEEDLLNSLSAYLNSLSSDKNDNVEDLEQNFASVSKNSFKMKKQLHFDLQKDDKQLKVLIDFARKSATILESLYNKGEQLLQLSAICNKFETEREQILKFSSLQADLSSYEEQCDLELAKMKTLQERPKTAVSFLKRPTTKSATSEDTPVPKITTIEKIKLHAKSSIQDSSSESSISEESNILDQTFTNLEIMETFWGNFNKAEVDVMEIKEEKKTLLKANKELRGMLRAILETAALSKSIPNSRVSTRVPSKRRSAYSAPLRRVFA